jgi:hypothetical protein
MADDTGFGSEGIGNQDPLQLARWAGCWRFSCFHQYSYGEAPAWEVLGSSFGRPEPGESSGMPAYKRQRPRWRDMA